MRILAVETSCDETSAAVVDDGRFIRSNIIASQIDIHSRYGGVVPEVASRQHVLAVIPTIEQALQQAGTSWEELDGLAVTQGPGLPGALLVGFNVGKSIAFARGLPFIGVNHLEGHIYSTWLVRPGEEPAPAPEFPALCLIVSGGHTDLVLMTGHGEYHRLGRTRDDAAGEAFDKVARILGLGYPGGPAIQRAAEGRSPDAIAFPRAWLGDSDDFSFSGLKTAAQRELEKRGGTLDQATLGDFAASFQEAIVDVLVTKTVNAARRHNVRNVLLAGGVAANRRLRERLIAESPVVVRVAPPELCTDNAAMIAAAGYFRLANGARAALDLDIRPNLALA